VRKPRHSYRESRKNDDSIKEKLPVPSFLTWLNK